MGAVTSALQASLKGLIASLSGIFARQPPLSQKTLETGNMTYHIVVGTYTDSVNTLTFDPKKPADEALSLSSTLPVGFHPSWVERHPTDPSLVFTSLEQPEGLLLALRYEAQTGVGKVLASIPSGGHSPCSILVTEEEVLVGNVRPALFLFL